MPRFTFLVPRRLADLRDEDRALLARDLPQAEAGDAISEWERAVAARVGAPHAVAVNSGRQGMTAILRHLGVGPGAEVVVPAYTLAGLLPLIQGLGARPVCADIHPGTLNVTAESIDARLTPRTRAVLVLHAFGAPAPMPEIMALAGARGIPVVEDGAHALGAAINGQAAGAIGRAGFYSFEPTKPVNTYGGGMVVTADADLAAAVRAEEAAKPLDPAGVRRKADSAWRERRLMLSGLGRLPLHLLAWPAGKRLLAAAYRGAQQVPPGNCRYTGQQAMIGLAKLADLDARLARRARNAAWLSSRLDDLAPAQQLLPGATGTWYFHVVRLPVPAARVRSRLLARGIDAAVGDEIADDCAALLGQGDCPEARHAFGHGLALPMFDDMDEVVLTRIAVAVRRALG